ncbi:hypothetical protein [Planctomyces sp. SH-PL14]|uniref:hypothetical protein n=1 Tax=Planctomyces sp. SH-PL14 TaxID=1632864 RepID=UPI00078B51B7|nr:hypothetical protein [Planctomyces sp. SH-PL14]AMV20103.1 hypothetical protein VT03_19565 [Planctomyces sp. SH-PL14]
MCIRLIKILTQVTTESPVGRPAFAAHLRRIFDQLNENRDSGPEASPEIRPRSQDLLVELAAIEEALTGVRSPVLLP